MINSLTSLRAFAAAGLLFFHQMRIIVPIPSNQAFALGVSFFFVLSGFILAINYQNLRPSGLGRFFLARFARLYPVHIFTMVLFGLAFAPTIFFDPDWRKMILLNTTLVQAWVPFRGFIFSMNTVSWSVSVELFFYLLFPLLIWAKRPGLVFGTILAITVISILTVEHFADGSQQVGPWEFTPAEMMVNTPYFRFAEFACGVWFASLYRRGLFTKIINAAPTLIELLVVGAVLAFAAISYDLGVSLMSPGNVLLGVWVQVAGGMLIFGLLLLVMAHQKGTIGRLLQTRPMVLLGETSFALYMIHSIVINVVMIYDLFPGQHWSVRFMLVTTSAYLGSFLIWRFVERPCRKAILSAPDWIAAWRRTFDGKPVT